MILVLGASGRLGAHLASHPQCMGLTRAELDITDHQLLCQALTELEPDVVVNCAAYTDVVRAEVEYEQAMKINHYAVHRLAWACRDRGIRLTHVSTDYVLSTLTSPQWLTEVSPAGPQGWYAKSKHGGEVDALAAGAQVVRVQWLYARDDGGFLDRALQAMAQNKPVRIIQDQVGCPTTCTAIGQQLLSLAAGAPPGLWHLACRGEASYLDWLREAAEVTETPWRGVPIRRDEVDGPPRPARSCLDSSRAETFLDVKMPSWRESLRNELG